MEPRGLGDASRMWSWYYVGLEPPKPQNPIQQMKGRLKRTAGGGFSGFHFPAVPYVLGDSYSQNRVRRFAQLNCVKKRVLFEFAST